MNRKIVSAFVAVSIVAFPNKHIRAYESTKLVRPKKITLGYERTLRSVKNIGSGRLKIEKHYVYELSDKEKNELQRIAYAEARGSGIKAMGLVMQVVMNRVKKYGSVHDVIFAPGQFEPVSNGMMSKAKTTASTIKALDCMMKGEFTWLHADYFIESSIYDGSWHQKALRYVMTYKSHVFCAS